MAKFHYRGPQALSSRMSWLLILIFAIMLLSQVQVATALQVDEIPSSYNLVAENDNFQLFVDSDTLAFKLLDKRSNYLWHSGLDEVLEDDRLNSSWEAFAKSGLSIEYLDDRASNRRASITNSNSTVALTPIDQGISAEITFEDYGITVGLILQLEDEGIRVEIPENSIREETPESFRLGQVYLYPFLGATRGTSVPGYMFIPDGTGSLIRYGDTTRATNMLYGRYYGLDLGMVSELPYDPLVTNPYRISYPVFGAVHGEGENAFLSIVEEGAAYGEVDVHPAGVITNFNFLNNTFIYNQPYFQATNRSGAGVTTVQRDRNAFDAIVHYRFLTGEDADYIGMARSYQQYLLDKDLLHRVEDTNPDIGVRLEFLGGDSEAVLLWERFVPMTTISQMGEILNDLQIPNPEVILYGWQPSGASSVPPASVQVEGQLGTLDELHSLSSSINENGGHFSLYLDPQAALVEKPGYSPYNDLAMSITNVNLWGWNRYETNYFSLNPLSERLNAISRSVSEQLGAGLALDSIGSTLYSDFRNDQPVNRESMLDAYQSLLGESSTRLGLYRPNDYLFGVTQAYYDMPLSDSGYIYTSETVPFLPAVLSGYIPYYGTPLNFSSNWQDDLLRHIEYGIYPSYFLTHEPTSNMLNTPSGWIYSSSFAQWGEEIRDTYAWMNALLAPVRGQEIVAHEQLADNVFATTYANGMQIIVNYTDVPFMMDDITVEPRNAVLVERGL